MEKEDILELERRFAMLLKGPKRLKANASKIDSKKKITAAELQAQLQEDEEYQKWLKEKEVIGQTLEDALRTETRELLNDLEGVGLKVSSVYDLVNTSKSYKEAIPFLIEHLAKPYHSKNKEGIVRALAVKEAIGKTGTVLIEEYRKTPKDKKVLRWVIGNTLYTTVAEKDLESILSIVQDKDNGESRQMFVAALGKIKSEKAENVLIDLLDDDEVVLDAIKALGRLKSKKAKEKINVLASYSTVQIRKEAQKALKKIG
jgi:HEAT repeat protein